MTRWLAIQKRTFPLGFTLKVAMEQTGAPVRPLVPVALAIVLARGALGLSAPRFAALVGMTNRFRLRRVERR